MSTYDNPDTPFDALAEEKAQRPTQPLPSRPGSPRARGGKLPVPTGELNDYGDLPEDEDNFTASAAPMSTLGTASSTSVPSGAPLTLIRRLRQTPTEILVGLSVVTGALLVVMVSLAMNVLVPGPPVNQDGMVGDLGPQVAILPDGLGNSGEAESSDDIIVEIVPSEEDEILVAERDEEPSTDSEEDDSREEERSSQSERERESDSDDKGRIFTHSEKGYRITLPQGFSLRDEGRRTIWKGPDDAQLLVETVSAPEGSPREGWEQLNKALARKYGSRYRNLGISETTLAGRPAAVWEFELTDKDGKKVRKIDIGVHHGGVGYAVLGEAPAKKFDDLRPQLERAIRSFQLPEKTSREDSKGTQSEPTRDTRERDTRDTSERRAQRSDSSASSKAKAEEKPEEVVGY